MKRKICVVTGTRADYGIYYSLLKGILDSNALSLYLIVTGMHLMKEFGYSVKEIKKDGFPIYQKVYINYSEDSRRFQAVSIGKAIAAFAQTFSRLQPSIVVVLGDRGEMLAAAIAANYLSIPVAHIHGGEISGHVDGIVRHAITKLAHIHFPATEGSQARLLKLGEEKWRIFVAGALALDRILHEKLTTAKELFDKYGIDCSLPLLILVQHPINTEADQAAEQIKLSLQALVSFVLPVIVIYPNADTGGRSMIEVIKTMQNKKTIIVIKNLPHKDYLALLKIAAVLVGNSSSGIIEAPSFKLPFVNIGKRQTGREHGANVINAPNNKDAIIKAIKKALYDKEFLAFVRKGQNPYGDGNAARRMVNVLSSIKLNKKMLEKKLTY